MPNRRRVTHERPTLSRQSEDKRAAAIHLTSAVLIEGGSVLLGPLSWRIEHGERWVVLGPNGAGKTSLMRLVGATRLPSRGEVCVLGERVGGTHLQQLRKSIGYTSGELLRRFDQNRSVLEVVVTADEGAMRAWRQGHGTALLSRARQLLAIVGCTDLEGRTFGSISDGERQRVLFARALMPHPKLLLLDEPAAGLDLGGREEMIRVLDDVLLDPTLSAVLVTHHVEEIPRGFSHALLLAAGRVTAAGPIEETLTSGSLSECFSMEISLQRQAGRYTAKRI